jgi:hypothetical protein
VLGCTVLNVLRTIATRQTVGAWVASHQNARGIGAVLRFSSGIGLDPVDIVVGLIDAASSLVNAFAKSRGLPVPSEPPAADKASVTTTDTHTVEVALPKPAPLPREDRGES